MAGYENFDRQYRFAAGKAGKKGFEVGHKSASQPVPLHINFSLQKADTETQNTGKVTIWNLNDAHLAALNEKDCVVSLRAGYNTHLSLIFAGIVSYATTSADGSDRKTEIEVIDSLVEVRDTYVSISYKGKVNWKTILDDVAAQMGVAISYAYNVKFTDVQNGYTYVGKARNILTKGCNCCGLAWSLQNGVLQVKRKNDVMSKEVYLLSAETGLLGIPARVVVSEDEATGTNTLGWDVEYLLNGAINIGDYVKVKSNIVTGYFRVHSIDMQGDNQSGDWICKARLLEVG